MDDNKAMAVRPLVALWEARIAHDEAEKARIAAQVPKKRQPSAQDNDSDTATIERARVVRVTQAKSSRLPVITRVTIAVPVASRQGAAVAPQLAEPNAAKKKPASFLPVFHRRRA